MFEIFINVRLVNETPIPASMKFDLNGEASIKIVFGPNDYFYGRMREAGFITGH